METKKRKVKKEVRVEQILDAAKRLFAQQGFENTTVRDIADLIGVSETLVFQIFKKKDAIYDELFERWAAEEKKVVQFSIVDGSALKTLYHIADDMIHGGNIIAEASDRDTLLATAVSRRYGYQEKRRSVIIEGSNIDKDSLLPIIQYGQKIGEIRWGNPLELACSFSSWIYGVLARKQQYPSVFFVPSINIALDMLRKKPENE